MATEGALIEAGTAMGKAQIEGINNSIDSGTQAVIDGLHEIIKDDNDYQDLPDDMQKLCDFVSELVDNTKPSEEIDNNTQAVIDSVMSSVDDSKKAKGKIIDKPSDIFKLPEAFSLPAILLWSKLDSIEKKLDKQFGDGKKKGGGFGDLFKGLLEGAAGILLLAVGLIIFAGALVLFGIVDWGSALLGMLSFTLFVLGSILIAKQVAKEKGTLREFAINVMLIVAGFLVFAFAMWVCGQLTVAQIMKGIFVAALFLVFVWAVKILAETVNASMGQFLAMAIGAGLMALALLIFGFALMVCGSLTLVQIIKGIIVAGIFLVFTMAVVFLAGMVTAGMPAFISMAIGAGLMSLALILFALAIVVCSLLTLEMVMNSLVTIGLFLLFTYAIIGLAASVTGGIPAMIALGVGAALMSVALVLFALALLVTGIIGKILMTDPSIMQAAVLITLFFLAFVAVGAALSVVSPFLLAFAGASILLAIGLVAFAAALMFVVKFLKPEMMDQFLAMLVPMGLIFLGMAAVGLAATVAVVFVTMFTACSIILLAGMLIFTLAVATMLLTSFVLEKLPMASFIGSMLLLFTGMLAVSLIATVALIPLALFMAASALLTVGMLFMLVTALAIKTISEQVDLLQLGETVLLIGGIFAACIPLGVIGGLAIIPIGIFAIAAGLLAGAMKDMMFTIVAMKIMADFSKDALGAEGKKPPAIQAINDIFSAANEVEVGLFMIAKFKVLSTVTGELAKVFKDSLIIFDAVLSVKAKVQELESQGITFAQCMDPFLQIFETVATAASGFAGMSKKAAQAMAIAIVPITEAIDNLAHTIVFIADFAMSPDFEAKMDAAKIAFGKMLTDFFGAGQAEPGPSTLLGMLYGMKKMPKGAAEAAAALAPLAQAVDSVANVVIKSAEMPDPDPAISKLQAVMRFMNELNTFAGTFKAGGFFSKSSSEIYGTAKESIDGMIPVIDSINGLGTKVNAVPDYSGEGIPKIRGTINFIKEMDEFTSIFKTGGWFSKSSSELYMNAKKAIDDMLPILDSIDNLGRRLDTLQPVQLELSTFKQVFDLANPEDLASKSKQMVEFAKKMSEAEKILPSGDKMMNLFNGLNKSINSGDWSKIGTVANNMSTLANAVAKVNSELTKLRNENSGTMKQVTEMNKGGGGLGGAISAIGNMFSGGGGKSGSGSDYTPVLREILEEVKSINTNTTKEEEHMFRGAF